MQFSYQVEVNATNEEIYKYYSDVNKWFEWEDDLEKIYLEDTFENNNVIKIKLKNQPEMEMVLFDVVENKAFSNYAILPFGKISFIHEIIECEKIYIKHTIRIEDFLNYDEAFNILNNIFSSVPNSVNKLKKEVEYSD